LDRIKLDKDYNFFKNEGVLQIVHSFLDCSNLYLDFTYFLSQKPKAAPCVLILAEVRV